MKPIKILGAGVSGLTAAINLAKEGYEVEVHEKLSDVGKSHILDFEGMESWTGDIIKILEKINIKINFKNKGFKKVVWYSPSFKEACLTSKKPFFYLVERGGKNSLEYSLKKQALDSGVNFRFNTDLKNADIISTGVKKPMGIAFSTFYGNVKSEDKAIGILSNKIAPNGYFYIIVWNKRASVCTTTSNFLGNIKINIRRLHLNNLKIDLCKRILGGAEFKHTFSGFANFRIPKTAVINESIYTGEAAGFQEAFLGFGMKYAFLSGYFAAKAIIENVSYDKLWKDSFLDELRESAYRRFLLNIFGNMFYEKIIENLESTKGIEISRFYHNSNLKHKLLYQISKIIMRC